MVGRKMYFLLKEFLFYRGKCFFFFFKGGVLGEAEMDELPIFQVHASDSHVGMPHIC